MTALLRILRRERAVPPCNALRLLHDRRRLTRHAGGRRERCAPSPTTGSAPRRDTGQRLPCSAGVSVDCSKSPAVTGRVPFSRMTSATQPDGLETWCTLLGVSTKSVPAG